MRAELIAARHLLQHEAALEVVGRQVLERLLDPAHIADARELAEPLHRDRLVAREHERFHELLELARLHRRRAGRQRRDRSVAIGVAFGLGIEHGLRIAVAGELRLEPLGLARGLGGVPLRGRRHLGIDGKLADRVRERLGVLIGTCLGRRLGVGLRSRLRSHLGRQLVGRDLLGRDVHGHGVRVAVRGRLDRATAVGEELLDGRCLDRLLLLAALSTHSNVL